MSRLQTAIAFRLEDDADDIRSACPDIRRLAEFVLRHYERFEAPRTIYGDLRPAYRQILKRVTS